MDSQPAPLAAGELERYLEASSRLHGIAHPERRDLWRDRLLLNAPELARFRGIATGDAAPVTLPECKPSELPVFAETPMLATAAAIGNGEVAADDVLAKALAAADRLGGHNIFTHLDRQPAYVAGQPLSGIPVAVKDLMHVRGLPMTGGTGRREAAPSSSEAAVITRLKAAGARVVGMTNLHELAYGVTSENPHFGRVMNPRDPERMAGGSSGGSAAAVAAGIVPFAVGTDTAGSVRIPAALCGVVGFKPSHGLLPRDGVLPLSWSLDHVGPFAASVADIAAGLAVMAGAAVRPGAGEPDAAGIRLVRPSNFFFDLCEPSVAAVLEDVLARIADAGIAIGRGEIRGAGYAAAAQFAILCPDAYQANAERLRAAPESLGADVRVRLEVGQFLRACDYVKAQRFRTRLGEAMREAMGQDGLLVTPTVPIGAPLAGTATVSIGGADYPLHAVMTRCTAPFNLTGFPAITLPCGLDRNGMPVGLQLVAPYGEDGRLLAAAKRIESIIGEHRGMHAGA